MENLQEIWVKKEAELAQNQMARLRIGGRMTHVNRCWGGLSKKIEQGRAKTDDIISEANNVVNKIMDLVKILCDVKGSRFRVYFDELANIGTVFLANASS
ncbi:hypothetical protein Tco_0296642 [Tanacetum coccineum]